MSVARRGDRGIASPDHGGTHASLRVRRRFVVEVLGDLDRDGRVDGEDLVTFALHFGDFIKGLVRSEAIAFYAIVTAIALTLNTSYLQWRR